MAGRYLIPIIQLAVLAVGWVSPVFADDEYCIEDWACAGYTLENGNAIHYWAQNRKPYPITMTVMVDTENLQSAQKEIRKHWEFTLVLQGYETKPLVQFTRTEPKRPKRHSYKIKWIPGDMYAQHDNDYRYDLPFAKESDYRVVQGYGGGWSHQGGSRYALDFAMPIGTPVHAARDGVVIDITQHHNLGGESRRFAQYANFVVILHSDGTTGEYYHLKQNGVVVKIGDEVKAGQHIGYSGNTGFSSLPHLHFAVYRAKSHGKFESIPVTFNREPNTWQRRGLGNRD